MEADVPVLEIPEQRKEINPLKMRRFVRHLATAATVADEKSQQKVEIRNRIERIKQLSLNKRSTKQEIESELGSFEDMVREVIKDEEKILEEQRKGTKQINELKSMVELLSKKLISLGGDYTEELDDKDKKILELREALATAHINLSDSGVSREEKIRKIEERVRSKPMPPAGPTHAELYSQLGDLERLHAKLKKNGKHPKNKLDLLKKKIDLHKKTLSNVKK